MEMHTERISEEDAEPSRQADRPFWVSVVTCTYSCQEAPVRQHQNLRAPRAGTVFAQLDMEMHDVVVLRASDYSAWRKQEPKRNGTSSRTGLRKSVP